MQIQLLKAVFINAKKDISLFKIHGLVLINVQVVILLIKLQKIVMLTVLMDTLLTLKPINVLLIVHSQHMQILIFKNVSILAPVIYFKILFQESV